MVKLLVIAATILVAVQLITLISSSREYWDFYWALGDFIPDSPYGSSLDTVSAVLPRRASSSPLLLNNSLVVVSHGEVTSVYAVEQCQLGDPVARYD
ncbi:hypothetical protein C2845_PM01G42670 [Panicum miliaceum]|uniref:Uncharacterized protein n=1 Tax=Panicum miliaceum TaxID=4540 RepID=A0A3L6TPJ2_PANMI|nr:hypothetical protein C2845_PM01G42670 [Panicum miliaceum]